MIAVTESTKTLITLRTWKDDVASLPSGVTIAFLHLIVPDHLKQAEFNKSSSLKSLKWLRGSAKDSEAFVYYCIM